MTSADSNLFVYAADPDSPGYAASRRFFESTRNLPGGFALCELVLVEVYMLLRNPAIFAKPYSAKQAVDYCQALRRHPTWEMVDYEPEVSTTLWKWAQQSHSGFRHIIDARIGLTLRQHGVTDFATANLRDFQNFGFRRVWNPTS
jgi:predicted nucleic acid-binding protein